MRFYHRLLYLCRTKSWRACCDVQRPRYYRKSTNYRDVNCHLLYLRSNCEAGQSIWSVRSAYCNHSVLTSVNSIGPTAHPNRHFVKNYCTTTEWTSWTRDQTASYIHDVTEVSSSHLTPEVKLNLITPSCALWAGRGDDCKVPDPFWAFYWPGGQALTRYVLDHPGIVRSQTVLDVGSGCGASAIAAAISGARRVIANDICPVAVEAIKMNAVLNNVPMEADAQNLIGQMRDQWDVLFLGDMFYDQDFTNMVTDWLVELNSRGKRILIGDPGRIYFEKHPIKKRLKMVYSVELLKQTMEENNGIIQGFVWEFT